MDPEEIEALKTNMMEAVNDLRETVKAKDADSAENKERMEKSNAKINEIEDIQQKAQATIKSAEGRELEMKERMDGLENALLAATARPGATVDYKDSPEYKALTEFAKTGIITVENGKSLLRTDNLPQAGVLVPTELSTTMEKVLNEVSNIRAIGTVQTMGGKSLTVPSQQTLPTPTWEGEAAPASKSGPTFGAETIVPYRQTVITEATDDMLMDSAFNIEAILRETVGESFAIHEGTAHVLGTGVKQPEGFLVSGLVSTGLTTASVGTVTASDVVGLTGALKTGVPNPIFTINRQTLTALRIEVGSDGHFIWQPGINGVIQNSLAGFDYSIVPDMPTVAAGSFPIAFGDFRKYKIYDRTGMIVIRDDFTQKAEAVVEFAWKRWTTGRVIIKDAIIKMLVKS